MAFSSAFPGIGLIEQQLGRIGSALRVAQVVFPVSELPVHFPAAATAPKQPC